MKQESSKETYYKDDFTFKFINTNDYLVNIVYLGNVFILKMIFLKKLLGVLLNLGNTLKILKNNL